MHRNDRRVSRLLRLAHDGLALRDAVQAREQTADDVTDLGFAHVDCAARLASAALCRAWDLCFSTNRATSSSSRPGQILKRPSAPKPTRSSDSQPGVWRTSYCSGSSADST